MERRAFGSLGRAPAALVAVAFSLQGCPLSDDYYIDEDMNGGGGAVATGGAATGGTATGGTATGGAATGGTATGGTATGGAATGGTATGCVDCPPGCFEELRDGKSYLFCTIDREYPTAETTCASVGMTLALIDDALEDAWVWTTLDRRYLGTQPFGFIGADDRGSEGEWFFADGVQFWSGAADGELVGARYVQWGSSQPNDRSPVTFTQEDCGAITLIDGSWNDVRCELACPFVCEAP